MTSGGAREGAGRKPMAKKDRGQKLWLYMKGEHVAKLDALCKEWECSRSEAVVFMLKNTDRPLR